MAKDNNQSLSDSSVAEVINAQDIITDKVESKESQVDPITKREGIYNDLIDAYKSHYKTKSMHNRGLKIAFFCIIMGLIAFLIFGLVVLCVIVVCKWDNSSQSKIGRASCRERV